MPLYGFKERFCPFVMDGTKKQTIRAYRKRPTRPGDFAYLYYGLKTKYAKRLLEPQKIKEVKTVVIMKDCILVLDTDKLSEAEAALIISGKFPKGKMNHQVLMHEGELNDFAWSDGFRFDDVEQRYGCFRLMKMYFGNSLPFVGNLIKW